MRHVIALFVLTVWLAASCTDTEDPAVTPITATSPTATLEASVTPVPATAEATPPDTTPAPPAAQDRPAVTLNQIGFTDLERRSASAYVRVLGNFAYVGSTSGGGSRGLGVSVVDLSDPAKPRQVATATRFPNTTAEDVVPIRVSTPAFTGDLLAVGIQRCSTRTAAPAGLALVDITDPRNPSDLAFFDITGGAPLAGVHELDVTVRQDGRVLALLATPLSEQYGQGDLRIVDISDPRRPVQLATWGAGNELGITVSRGAGVGCTRTVLAHSVSAGQSGTRAYISYWDAGAVLLDITDPTRPRLIGRLFDPNQENDIHSAIETPGGLLVVTEESGIGGPPPNLQLRTAQDGQSQAFPACEIRGNAPLNAAGIISGSGIASLNVWGVAVAGDLVLASDIEQGLFILRMSGAARIP